MGTLRSTFILRCWHLPDGTERVAIEHVQSGEQTLVATVAAALDWLAGRTGHALPEASTAGALVAPPPPDP